MSNETKLNAEPICFVAAQKIRSFLRPRESCELSKDESKAYFVFRFMESDADDVREIGRLFVLGSMIEDGIISERELHAFLWQELGQIRGMV